MANTPPLILAADIGGTNTRVALLNGTELQHDSVQRFENAGATCLEEILANYVKTTGARPDAVSLALAGPITGDQGALTNLDWSITASGAVQAVGAARGVLLNDLQAQGCALPYIEYENLLTILPGKRAEETASCLMIGVGTGMNVSPVHYVGGRAFVPPAEAGHTTFGAHSPALRDLADAFTQRLGHMASEDILSGRGVEQCFTFVTGTKHSAPEIMALCAAGDEKALKAIGLVVQALGHFAGDQALTHLPRGGVFLVGGVARAIAPYMHSLGFNEAFMDKGRFSGFMAQFPVHVLTDDYAALTGAASYAMEHAR